MNRLFLFLPLCFTLHACELPFGQGQEDFQQPTEQEAVEAGQMLLQLFTDPRLHQYHELYSHQEEEEDDAMQEDEEILFAPQAPCYEYREAPIDAMNLHPGEEFYDRHFCPLISYIGNKNKEAKKAGRNFWLPEQIEHFRQLAKTHKEDINEPQGYTKDTFAGQHGQDEDWEPNASEDAFGGLEPFETPLEKTLQNPQFVEPIQILLEQDNTHINTLPCQPELAAEQVHTPIFTACWNGLEVIKEQNNADCTNRVLESLQLLLANGADANKGSFSWYQGGMEHTGPLAYIAGQALHYKKSYEELEEELEEESELEQAGASSKKQELLAYCHRIATLLVTHGANKEQALEEGKAYFGQEDEIRELLEQI